MMFRYQRVEAGGSNIELQDADDDSRRGNLYSVRLGTLWTLTGTEQLVDIV